ncbi:MAG: hypothetical protein IKH94_04595 [Eubacterium sp.]|nr:hypothetical protein [Eubacterium sp.]
MKLKYFGCSLLQFILFNLLLIIPLMLVLILSINNVNSALYKKTGAYTAIASLTDKMLEKMEIDKSVFDSNDLLKLNEDLAVESQKDFFAGMNDTYNFDKFTDFLKKNEDKITQSRGEGLTEKDYSIIAKYKEILKGKTDDSDLAEDGIMNILKFFSSKSTFIILCVVSVILILLIALILKGYFENALIFYIIPTICSGALGALFYSALIGLRDGNGGSRIDFYNEFFGSARNIHLVFLILGIGLIVARVICKKRNAV